MRITSADRRTVELCGMKGLQHRPDVETASSEALSDTSPVLGEPGLPHENPPSERSGYHRTTYRFCQRRVSLISTGRASTSVPTTAGYLRNAR